MTTDSEVNTYPHTILGLPTTCYAPLEILLDSHIPKSNKAKS